MLTLSHVHNVDIQIHIENSQFQTAYTHTIIHILSSPFSSDARPISSRLWWSTPSAGCIFCCIVDRCPIHPATSFHIAWVFSPINSNEFINNETRKSSRLILHLRSKQKKNTQRKETLCVAGFLAFIISFFFCFFFFFLSLFFSFVCLFIWWVENSIASRPLAQSREYQEKKEKRLHIFYFFCIFLSIYLFFSLD